MSWRRSGAIVVVALALGCGSAVVHTASAAPILRENQTAATGVAAPVTLANWRWHCWRCGFFHRRFVHRRFRPFEPFGFERFEHRLGFR